MNNFDAVAVMPAADGSIVQMPAAGVATVNLPAALPGVAQMLAVADTAAAVALLSA
jgi:hypothetical protein